MHLQAVMLLFFLIAFNLMACSKIAFDICPMGDAGITRCIDLIEKNLPLSIIFDSSEVDKGCQVANQPG